MFLPPELVHCLKDYLSPCDLISLFLCNKFIKYYISERVVYEHVSKYASGQLLFMNLDKCNVWQVPWTQEQKDYALSLAVRNYSERKYNTYESEQDMSKISTLLVHNAHSGRCEVLYNGSYTIITILSALLMALKTDIRTMFDTLEQDFRTDINNLLNEIKNSQYN